MVDLEKRTKKRRERLRDTWSSKEWKEKRLAFIGTQGCSWCGSREYLTVHHPYRNGYGKELYMDFYLSQCVVLCRRCHAALHAGKELCSCKQGYKPFDADTCFTCYSKKHPEILEKVQLHKQVMKDKKKASDKAYRAKLKASKNKGI